MLLTAKILLTVVTLGYSFIPAMADFNKTHATNPKWLPHARYHVVWQVSSNICIALVAFYLIWGNADRFGLSGLWLAAGLAACAYIGFYAAAITKPIYSGAQHDVNGVQPVHVTIRRKRVALDVNMTVFTFMSVLLVVALICLMRIGSA